MLASRPLEVTLGLCAVLVTAAAAAFLVWGRSPDEGGPGLPELIGTMQTGRARGEALTRRLQAMARCLEGKYAVAQQVLAGRLKLLEAAARFRDLQNAVPQYDWAMFRERYPGQSDEERHCQAVIGFVEQEAQARGTDPGVVEELQVELRSRLQQGTLHLATVEQRANQD
jgi:hypothetical protein